MIRLSTKALEEVQKSNIIKGKLCVAFDRSMRAIEQWIDKKDPLLTSKTALLIIQEETGLTDRELFENINATA